VVGANGVDAKGKLIDEVVDERDGVLLAVPLVDFERADARRVVDGRVLVLCQVSRLIHVLAHRNLPVWQEQRNPSNYQLTNEVL
jgi:hypothetical protein